MEDVWKLIIDILCGLLLGFLIMLGSKLIVYGITPFYRVFGCIILIFVVIEMYDLIRG